MFLALFLRTGNRYAPLREGYQVADMIARTSVKPPRSLGRLQALAIALLLIVAGVAIARADYVPELPTAQLPEGLR